MDPGGGASSTRAQTVSASLRAGGPGEVGREEAGLSGHAAPNEASTKARGGGRRPRGAEERAADQQAGWGCHSPGSIGCGGREVVGGAERSLLWWRRGGRVAGRFVCLFGKPEPGETVARFSLDGMGANGSVWQQGSPDFISLRGRRGAEG